MIDEDIKWAATFQEYKTERIMVTAYIKAEALARLWEDRCWGLHIEKTIADYVKEVEAELSK